MRIRKRPSESCRRNRSAAWPCSHARNNSLVLLRLAISRQRPAMSSRWVARCVRFRSLLREPPHERTRIGQGQRRQGKAHESKPDERMSYLHFATSNQSPSPAPPRPVPPNPTPPEPLPPNPTPPPAGR